MSVEEKLAQYRRRKQQELNENHCKTSAVNLRNALQGGGRDRQDPLPTSSGNHRNDNRSQETFNSGSQGEELQPLVNQLTLPVESSVSRRLHISSLVLKFLLWASLMTLFVHIEFGAVYFVCSVFYLIFTNFRSGPKKIGAPSAYSVFNPNCEGIDGTLTAEQFERELKFGAMRM